MVQTGEVEEIALPCDDVDLLLREIAAWEAASEEDALKIDRFLAELE